ncbi:MAG: hypothetical protein QW228_06970 [Candidatus Aenigmatarchaeota archaeon]
MLKEVKDCIRFLLLEPYEDLGEEYGTKEWWKMAESYGHEYALKEALEFIKAWKNHKTTKDLYENEKFPTAAKILYQLDEKELVSITKEVLDELIEQGNEIYKDLLNLTQDEKELLIDTIKEVLTSVIKDDETIKEKWLEYQDTGYDMYNLAAHTLIVWKLAVKDGEIKHDSLTPMQKLIYQYPVADLYFFGFLQQATQKVQKEVLK